MTLKRDATVTAQVLFFCYAQPIRQLAKLKKKLPLVCIFTDHFFAIKLVPLAGNRFSSRVHILIRSEEKIKRCGRTNFCVHGCTLKLVILCPSAVG
jgi:hypothetical protein